MGLSILAVLPLIWKGIVCQVPFPVPGFDISVNSSVSVQEGLCVTIPCSFIADGRKTFNNTSGYWIRRQSHVNVYYIVATNNRSTAVKKTNFHLTGNPDTGDCTLTITDAKEEDNGIYYFRFVESRSSTLKYNYNREAITAITVTGKCECIRQ
ncbi:myeloid cell surface antigen CD33-like [Ranitomeya variabilis]|uniref:myeloid cell surface antigen CD33-like n=1 Tax=Ranitomeya variabilis TaxID=490064 RepID=UPI0040574719